MAVSFISADLVALQVKFAEQSKELANRVHGVFAAPSVNYFGSVTIAEGQHRLVAWSGEIAEGSRPAGSVFWRVIDQSSDMLEFDHRIAFVVEPLGAVFDPEHAIFEVRSIGFNFRGIHMRASRRRDAEGAP
jgi:hypothetical protein